MQWSVTLAPGVPNGWILPVILYLSFGILLAAFPRSVAARLYDRSNQGGRRVVPHLLGVLLVLAWLTLSILTPLRQGHAVLPVGLPLYASGLAGFLAALLRYAGAPPDQPITTGLCRLSRHPQQFMISAAFLGASVAMESWPALLLMGIAVVGGHFKLLAEEKACLRQYGDPYRDCMRRVPRCSVFF
jgi:protein-S-isoprenylcysteine O-methyltransferase Ste14